MVNYLFNYINSTIDFDSINFDNYLSFQTNNYFVNLQVFITAIIDNSLSFKFKESQVIKVINYSLHLYFIINTNLGLIN